MKLLDIGAADIVSRREPVLVQAPAEAAQTVRLIAHQGFALEPEALATMTAAYDAVLQELRLVDREDAGTLAIAKHVVELAGQGERDAQRLATATLARLSR